MKLARVLERLCVVARVPAGPLPLAGRHAKGLAEATRHMTLISKTSIQRSLRQRLPGLDPVAYEFNLPHRAIPRGTGAKGRAKAAREAPSVHIRNQLELGRVKAADRTIRDSLPRPVEA